MGVTFDVYTTRFKVRNVGPLLFFVSNSLLNVKEYDVVHSNEGAGLLTRHPNIVETYHHDYAAIDRRYVAFNIVELQHCKRAKHVIVPSFSTKHALASHGIEDDKISVIYHGVDEIFRPRKDLRAKIRSTYGLDEETFVIISIGRLTRHKRHVDIVRALKNVPATALILVGKGECWPEISEAAREASVRLLHFQDVKEDFLVELLNASDLYVHASRIEGFGMTVLEAMACSLPVVACETADFDRLIGHAGMLMRDLDVDELSNIIAQLQQDKDLLRKMSSDAVSRSQKFTWQQSAATHLGVYADLCKSQ